MSENEQSVESEIAAMSPEDRELEAATLAAQVIAGSLKVLPIKAVVGEGTELEQKVEFNLRVPNLDDESFIGSMASSYHPGVAFDALSAADRELAQARAHLEVLGVAPFPDWCPLTKEPVEWNGKKERRPNTADIRGRAKPIAILRAYRRVYVRFQ